MKGIAKVDDASSFLIAEPPCSSNSMWQFAVVSWDSVGLGDDLRPPLGSSTTCAIWQLIGDVNLLSSKLVMCSSSMYLTVESLTLRLNFHNESPRNQFVAIWTPTRRFHSRQLMLNSRLCDVRRSCRGGCRLWPVTGCHTRSAERAPRRVDFRRGWTCTGGWTYHKDSTPARWCCNASSCRRTDSYSSCRRFRREASPLWAAGRSQTWVPGGLFARQFALMDCYLCLCSRFCVAVLVFAISHVGSVEWQCRGWVSTAWGTISATRRSPETTPAPAIHSD